MTIIIIIRRRRRGERERDLHQTDELTYHQRKQDVTKKERKKEKRNKL